MHFSFITWAVYGYSQARYMDYSRVPVEGKSSVCAISMKYSKSF